MSKRITSYVCINLSCLGSDAHTSVQPRPLPSSGLSRYIVYMVDQCGYVGTESARLRIATARLPFNERYSIIFKFNERLVNNINESRRIYRY